MAVIVHDRCYQFEDTDLASRSSAELHALIARNLEQACVEPAIDEDIVFHRDYARDIIAQARDILLDRGESFSAYDRLRLSFLHWPQTTSNSNWQIVMPTQTFLQLDLPVLSQISEFQRRAQFRRRTMKFDHRLHKRGQLRSKAAAGTQTTLVILAAVLLLYLS